MIEVFIDKRFGLRASLAIERHVNDPSRNVLPRKAQLYHVGLREPNYPVPAIPLKVYYVPHTVGGRYLIIDNIRKRTTDIICPLTV